MAYNTPFSENFTILVGKVETTPGVMETLDNDDFDFKVFNPTVSMTVEPDDEAAKHANGHHGEDKAVMGMQYGTIGFSVKLALGANRTTAPKWGKFVEGCGLYPQTYTGLGYGYMPLKAYDERTLSIWIYKIQQGATPKATCFKFSGCMGKLTIGAEGTGKPIMLNFSFDGKLEDVDFDVANASIPEINNVDETCYEKALNASIVIDGLERLVDSFQLDTGNEVTMLKDLSESTGIKNYSIVSRKPRFTCNPLMQGVTGTYKSDYDYLFGSATGCPSTPDITITTNHWVLKLPKNQMISCAPGGRDGRSHFEQTWKCLNVGYTGSTVDANIPYEATFVLGTI